MDERRTFIVAVTSPSSWSSSLVSRWKRRTCETWARRALPCAISASISARTSAISARERSEEHTSELQSPCNLVCRLLLEKKKKRGRPSTHRCSLAWPYPGAVVDLVVCAYG